MPAEITPTTKIDDLLREYPHLLDLLIEQSPMFSKLKNPVMRKMMGKIATLEKAASLAGLDTATLVATLKAAAEAPVSAPGSATDGKHEELKRIIKDLHDGMSVEEVKERFKAIVGGVDAADVAAMEQALIDEGLPAEEIKNLCDVHVEIFREALEEEEVPDVAPGHPIHTYMMENRALEHLLSKLSLALGRLLHYPGSEALGGMKTILAEFSQVNIHYTRKENQFFPMLEAHHFTGPSQVMWSIHDDIRKLIKQIEAALEQGDMDTLRAAVPEATKAARDMIYKEEHILFPASLNMLSDNEWLRMKEGEAQIGFAWVLPEEGWPGEVEITTEQSGGETAEVDAGGFEGSITLDTGSLNAAQINMMLKHMPVDMTFVDENDRVAYYSDSPERIFPRSPAIIGREVRNCHPPKSVHVVNMILDAFKAGERDTAAFWLELGGRFIHIRYFAMRNAKGLYQGTLEVSQDVTEIRKLEGDSKLLDWE